MVLAQAEPAATGTPADPPAATAASPGSETPSPDGAAAPAEGEAPANAENSSEGTDGEAAGDAAPTEGEEGSETANWLNDMLNSGALGLLREGGFFMWPILFMGVLALGVIIERYRSLKMLSTDANALRDKVLTLLREDRPEEALEVCNTEQGPVPAILGAGLRKFIVLRRLNYDPGKIEEQVVKAMEDYSVHIVAALERHLPVLATISSVAPMLGFLGTVQGMIVSFNDIVAQMGEKNIVEAAAGGISVALLTTCFGLIVGIPAFIGFNYFSSVINRFVLDVEESSTDLIEAVTLQMAIANQQPSQTSHSDSNSAEMSDTAVSPR